jgi:DNA repair protein RecO (recombination protein O)
MDERATGIVLRTHPLTETSLVVHWLTAEVGRIATVAKGARRDRSPFRGLLDLFYLCDLSFARSRRSDLHTLREARLRDAHVPLRTDLGWLRQAAYGAALIQQTTETDTPLPGVFALYQGLLDELPRYPPQPLTIFAFEMRLLGELGLAPNLVQARLTSGSRAILERCAAESFLDPCCIKLSPAQMAEIRRYLHDFLLHHLERVPPGRQAALGA